MNTTQTARNASAPEGRAVLPRLRLLHGPRVGICTETPRVLAEREVVAIGREVPEDEGLPLDDLLASRRHAEVCWHNGAVVLRDLESKNGTSVNGQRVHEVALKDGDVVRI